MRKTKERTRHAEVNSWFQVIATLRTGELGTLSILEAFPLAMFITKSYLNT